MADLFKDSFKRTEFGEVYTTTRSEQSNVRCTLGGTQSGVETNYYGFIDLSDTTNWPHKSTGFIGFNYLALVIDKASNSTGTIDLQLITRIDGTSADLTTIVSAPFIYNASEAVQILANFSPAVIKCEVVSGQTPFIKTNNKQTNVTAVNTATPVAFGPGGATFTPAVGDLLCRINTTGQGALTWGFSAIYRGFSPTGA